ncbi:DUF3857 domain-containing protein [Pedobacter frigidisoli]|uniref:DUF3857 domain-containing protein n=1 Tax=Pedobacter frigidisoli TaxID=2530455 RepID=A0A4R0NMC9_9SPHI|nr:DUF3857 domain-containing protein [Pedobacter frigidisoli]TCD00743.1 DUF3857 domain-containing protein [Pedobacter frigidisoli]
MKINFTLLFILIFPIILFAQKQATYNQKAEEIKKNVWDKQNPMFEANTVPEKYSNESAVVLARSFDMQRTAGGKFKFMIITAASITEINKSTTWREKIKINDKAALERYSTLEYDKIIDKTTSFLLVNVKDKKEVFVGVKIIKPNGKEVIVNTSEEVILANSKNKDKSGKLAIPDLQVGDIIDYYISTVQIKQGSDDESENRYTFLLADEYPILSYSYKFQYGKKINVFNMSTNGAPEAEVSTNEANDQIFIYAGKNVPKYVNEIWSSPYRELPYFCISSYFRTKYDQMTIPGVNPLSKLDRDKKISRLNNYLEDFKASFFNRFIQKNDFIKDHTEDYFKTNKAYKNAPLDSILKVLYNNWKYSTFSYYSLTEFDINEMNYRTANSKLSTQKMCKTLCDMEIPHNILVVSSRFSNSLDDVFEENDFKTLIRVNGPKSVYLCFDRINLGLNEIPVDFQGEKAVVLSPRKRGDYNYVFTQSTSTIPVTTFNDNVLAERLKVDFSKDNMQVLTINRNVNEIGLMKLSDQLNLCYVEDIDKEITLATFNEDLKKRSTDRKYYNAVQAAFDNGRKDIKKHFISEITDQYEQEPKDLINFKVNSSGILTSKLEHESSFTMENFVKKAGGNYILEVGKLIGKVSKVEADKKIRQTNIYMPAARSLSYDIKVNVPAGYKFTGIEALNTNITNTSGSFNATAKIDGADLILNVKRIYNVAYLDKKAWPEVSDLIDAAGNFFEQKVLLEKLN